MSHEIELKLALPRRALPALRRLQHRQRLNERPSRVNPDEAAAARKPVRTLWRAVFGE